MKRPRIPNARSPRPSNTTKFSSSWPAGRGAETTADRAPLLGITPRTLYRLIDSHRLHTSRFGRGQASKRAGRWRRVNTRTGRSGAGLQLDPAKSRPRERCPPRGCVTNVPRALTSQLAKAAAMRSQPLQLSTLWVKDLRSQALADRRVPSSKPLRQLRPGGLKWNSLLLDAPRPIPRRVGHTFEQLALILV